MARPPTSVTSNRMVSTGRARRSSFRSTLAVYTGTVLCTTCLLCGVYFVHTSLMMDQSSISADDNRFVMPSSRRASLRTRDITSPQEDNGEISEEPFSACLLTMDDNHFLIEWLAYHYHVLPLRHLIVAVDPKSMTSPSSIFDRWRQHGMEIEEWSDKDFGFDLKEEDMVSDDILKTQDSQSTGLHRERQRQFYKQCMKRHKEENRSWIIMTDVDEYIAFNTEEKFSSVSSFLSQYRANNELSPCLMIPRLRYGVKESTPEQVGKDVPQDLNASTFQTMRYRHHAPIHSLELNRYPKAIVDASRVDDSDITMKTMHRPVDKYCPTRLMYATVDESFLVINHYLGTWEQFSFRNDARKTDGRRTFEVRLPRFRIMLRLFRLTVSSLYHSHNTRQLQEYSIFKDVDNGDDDGVRPWLNEFVESVGSDTASALLEGVGHVPIKEKKKDGIIVLGMHRSGTSLLSGILTMSAGYKVGDEDSLIHANNENAKGYFERTDVARQNDIFMLDQNITWHDRRVEKFDPFLALDHKRQGLIDFDEYGRDALLFLNHNKNAPWILKDPRLCLTLPTWLGLLGTEPAIVFTYRHPLEVAKSVTTRARNTKWKSQRIENFTLEMGLNLWIAYNRKAVENSNRLCRVVTNNDNVLDNPFKEAQRMIDDLSSKCGVHPPPQQRLTNDTVGKFIDSKLQHKMNYTSKRKLAQHGECIIYDYDSEYEDGTLEKQREMDMYLKAMKIYCDFENGRAFDVDYEW